MMKRLYDKFLTEWLINKNRKPLILRGARQVGKSTLVRQFAKDKGLTLLEINLERHLGLDPVFKSTDIPAILRELEIILKRPVSGEKILLFFDEIQATPSALPALRYFHEDLADLPVIAAGSLLEFILADHDFSMPVGRVNYLHIGPMSFGEFLLALGEETLFNILADYRIGKPWPVMAHEKLSDYLRRYLFVGGMPESVLHYSHQRNLTPVREIQRAIIETYRDDFFKYTRADSERRLLHKIIDSAPTLIGRKMKYINISRDDRAAVVKSALFLLVKARVLIETYHTHCGGIPLKAGCNHNVYKPYFIDVGLMNFLSGLEWPQISGQSATTLLNDGVIAEQFAAQQLAYSCGGKTEPVLYYWLREGRGKNAEVDFVLQASDRIVPVEIKAGASGSLKSLHHLIAEKNLALAVRLDLNPPAVQDIEHELTRQPVTASFRLVSLPLPLAEFLPKIVSTMTGVESFTETLDAGFIVQPAP